MLMKRFALHLLLASCIAATLSAQTSSSPTASVSVRSGVVEVQRGNAWLPIAAGESVNCGERVRTGNASTAAIEIGAGAVVTIRELSQGQIVASSAGLTVRLEVGDMKQLAPVDMQPSTTDTIEPLDRRQQVDELTRSITTESLPDAPAVTPANQSPEQEHAPQSPVYVIYP